MPMPHRSSTPMDAVPTAAMAPVPHRRWLRRAAENLAAVAVVLALAAVAALFLIAAAGTTSGM